MSDAKTTLPSILVNAYINSVITVSEGVGIGASFIKPAISSGVQAPGSRVAAFIGIVGGTTRITISLMADLQGFEAYVAAFTGGIIKASPDDSMSMSVLGEMTNMISGRALIEAEIPGLDITPPQLVSGENIKLSPTIKTNVKSFTLPFNIGNGRVFLVLSVYG
ncbi:chemotaxis protein CheX [Synergistales bacterium]|nr:chemotaxis protein CheX [Synergistales bacterium]